MFPHHHLIVAAAALAAAIVSGAPLASAATIHHYRHVARSHRPLDVVRSAPQPSVELAPYGGYRAQVEGAPPNNMFNPTRPFGGQSAITAAPGTAAFEEQANERRYFCQYAPEHC